MKLYQTLILALFFVSCDNEIVTKEPELNIIDKDQTIKLGDKVRFTTEGNAGLISFYSGEKGKDYEFRQRRIIHPTDYELNFTSAVRYGSQVNQLALLVSTDFNGVYDATNIKAATWIDITNRYTWGSDATFKASTVKSLVDLRVAGKPFYIAYKYINRNQDINGIARQWQVESFNFVAKESGDTYPVADLINAGFRVVNDDAQSRATILSTRLTLYGDELNVNNLNTHEHWIISKQFNLDELNVGPDRPIIVKGNSDPKISYFDYTYTKAGSYKAQIVSANATINGVKEKVITCNIIVEP